MKRTYFIRAVWDDDAGVYYSESDILGLHIESASLDEFEEVMNEVAIELIMTNHVSAPELAGTPLRDLVPAIIWQRPERALAAI
jgi:Domain of unknown function (DUF1902)